MKTIIVVLGMHRSGTSSLAGVLNLLGIRAGDNCIPGDSSNPKGYFEDKVIHHVNSRLMVAMGANWDTLGLNRAGFPDETTFEAIFADACELIRSRLEMTDIWFFKDPRTCRLLPFWQKIFRQLNLRELYLVCVRNPLSVAASLQQRDSMAPAHALLLWLEHIMLATEDTGHCARAVVDYDRLLADPREQISRIDRLLALKTPQKILEDAQVAVGEFIEDSLRHSLRDIKALGRHPAVNGLIVEAFTLLSALAHDELGPEEFRDRWRPLFSRFRDLQSYLAVVAGGWQPMSSENPVLLEALHAERAKPLEELDLARAEIKSVREEHSRVLARLQQALEDLVREKGEALEAWRRARQETQSIRETHTRVQAGLEQKLEVVRREHEDSLGELNRVRAEIQSAKEEHAKALAELSRASRDLQFAREEHARSQAALQQIQSEREECRRDIELLRRRSESLQSELILLRESRSWRFTRPLRIVGQWLRRTVRSLARSRGTKEHSVLWLFARRLYRAVPMAEGRKLALKRRLQRALVLAEERSPQANLQPVLISSAVESAVVPVSTLPTPVAVISGANTDAAKPASDYVGLSDYLAVDTRIRAIAFYLPQFHPIPENDAWWGRGFTEWTNVSKAVPQFVGHYQPHLPGELGFYDLRLIETQKRQIELARQYGLHGFCYYYYWFNGRKILQRPLENLLAHPELDFPFCLCWANESWSRRWDGLESELLIRQNHGADDDLAFIREIAPMFADPRYIRIGQRPLLIVYRPTLMPDPAATGRRWRRYCQQHDVGDIALAYVQSFDMMNPSDIGFDYAIEFPPNTIDTRIITETVQKINSDYKGIVYDYPDLVDKCCSRPQPSYALFRGVAPSWDNEARKPGRGVTFHGATPSLYRQWLRDAARDMADRHSVEEQLVFVNAWNEWAEGAHLEPDRHYGYAWLQATADALRQFPAGPAPRKLLLATHDCHLHGAQLIILNICRRLRQQFGCELQIILCGEGELESEFAQCGQTHRWWLMTDPMRRNLLQRLRAELYMGAICNTVATGELLPELKAHGFQVVWLVHEMAGVIQQFGLDSTLRQTAKYADRVVFAARTVCDSFQTFAALGPEKPLIRPQGLYTVNRYLVDRDNVRQQVYRELDIPPARQLVLAVGFGDRRKAPDLFVKTAVEIGRKYPDAHFLWVGDLHRDMEPKVRELANRSGFTERFHFVGRTREVARYFAAADLYVLTSREDPFPTVVLEALHAGLPVVGFASAGGFSEVITPELGTLAPLEDTSALAQAALTWLDDPVRRGQVRKAGPALIAQRFNYSDYARDMAALCGCRFPKVSVVIPNYNYERYLPQRLQTILDQTYKPAEIIFLDDCSTDKSVEVARDILNRGNIPFRIIENRRNQGVFSQWLRGIEESAGELIWIAEADDLCEPALLARLVDGFRDDRVVLAYVQSRMIDEEGTVLADDYLQYTNEIDPRKWRENYLRPGPMEVADSLIVKNTIPNASAVLFRKPETGELRSSISHLKHAGDWMFYLHILQDGWIYFVADSLNKHRRHRNSVTLGARGLDLFKELLLVQNSWLPRISVNSHVADLIEKTRQSTYETLDLAGGKYLSYRDNPALADLVLADAWRGGSEKCGQPVP
ncbi:MAG: glycosyltransferase [Phycisphaerae bacterium]|nr:glycosyltransferase [Phycisphaerae bacterium]